MSSTDQSLHLWGCKVISEINCSNQLMQFLMGLNDTYVRILNQILVMNHLPSINKAYSMIFCVEKQRDIPVLLIETTETKRY